VLPLTRPKVEGAHRQASMLGQRRWKSTDATPREAVAGLARDSGRRAPTNIHAWTEGGGACRALPHCAEPIPWQAITGVPAAATPRGAVPGLAHDGGRRAPASVCRPPPHVRSRSRTRPQRWEARTSKAHGRAAPPPASPRPNCAHRTTVEPLQNKREEESGHAAPPPARLVAELHAPLRCRSIPSPSATATKVATGHRR
jgi:hypothetical protein